MEAGAVAGVSLGLWPVGSTCRGVGSEVVAPFPRIVMILLEKSISFSELHRFCKER